MFKKPRFSNKLTSMVVATAAGATLISGGALSVPAQAASSTPFIEGWPAWPTVGIVNPFTPTAINLGDFVNSPLAFYTQDNNSYIPAVASSWSLKLKPGQATNAVLTLHIRNNAKWSDGTPITAQDVKMSLQLGYILNTQVTSYIASITTPDAHTVVVTQNNKPFNLFEQQVLTTMIHATKVWGKYVPHNIQAIYVTSEGQGAAATKASSTLAGLAKQIAAVDVSKTDLSDGPFNLGEVTSSQINLPKNNNWWGASNVHVPSMELLAENGNNQSFAYALGGRVDYLTTYAPPNVVDSFTSRPGNHITAPDGNYGPGLYFNTSLKPFNNVAFRQAIAYIVDRSEVEKIAYPTGTSSVKAATATTYPSGLPPANYKLLSAGALRQMNPYNKNLSKATKLLESAGLKKVNGSWTLGGKVLKLQIACPGGYTDWVAVAENVATQLSQFGLNAQIRTVDTNTFFVNIPLGTYSLALGSVGSENLSPWYDYQAVVSTAEGLSITSTGKINRIKTTYNWGPMVKVPGKGNVNVVKLWNELVSSTDKSKEQSATDALALAVNQQLPVIDLLYNKFYAIFYSTQNWTGFPASNNPLWDPNVGSSAALMLIEQGYIKPAQ